MPSRKPTHLKALEGTLRGDSAGINAPKPRPVADTPPAWLDAEALELWHTIGPRLEKLGLLTELDGAAFAVLCSQYGIMRQAAAEISTAGATTTDSRGTPKKNPATSVYNQAAQLWRLMAADFGLTPLSRGRLDVHQVTDEEAREMAEMERLLSGLPRKH